MIRSPYRFPSYEPRFVIEDYNPAALHHAIALWKNHDWRHDDSVTHVARYPDTLLMTRGDHPGPFHPWEKLPVPLAPADIVPFITSWLATAEVDEPEPNFDGSEAKGFSAFWGYFRGEEADNIYGSFVVKTKWFEIHK